MYRLQLVLPRAEQTAGNIVYVRTHGLLKTKDYNQVYFALRYFHLTFRVTSHFGFACVIDCKENCTACFHITIYETYKLP